MPALAEPIEKPRKQPLQARSVATVNAILSACIQVLARVGKEKLTTTLVAERAGVSVGTLYQYFPNKRSLLQEVLRQHLLRVAEAYEQACAAVDGLPLSELVATTSKAFFRAKMVEPRASLALYSVSSDVDGLRVSEDLRLRNETTLLQGDRELNRQCKRRRRVARVHTAIDDDRHQPTHSGSAHPHMRPRCTFRAADEDAPCLRRDRGPATRVSSRSPFPVPLEQLVAEDSSIREQNKLGTLSAYLSFL